MARLSREDRMTIQSLARHGQSNRAVARLLGVTEDAVRWRTDQVGACGGIRALTVAHRSRAGPCLPPRATEEEARPGWTRRFTGPNDRRGTAVEAVGFPVLRYRPDSRRPIPGEAAFPDFPAFRVFGPD